MGTLKSVSVLSRRLVAVLLSTSLALGALVVVSLASHRADAAVVTSVVEWGDSQGAPSSLTRVSAVAAGWGHSLALKNNGSVVAWGSNGGGQTAVPAGLTGVKAIGAGSYFSLAVASDGSVVAWGDNGAGQTDVPPGLSGVAAVAAGSDFAVALLEDGTVTAWGSSSFGKTDVPVGLNDVVQISANSASTVAVKSDGTVVAWGWDIYGQVSGASEQTNITQVSVGRYDVLARKSDGTVIAWGSNRSGSTDVPVDLSGATAVAAGADTSYALLSDGTVRSWGLEASTCAFPVFGQCPGFTPTVFTPPVGLSGVTAIDADLGHALAIHTIESSAQEISFGSLANKLASAGDFEVSATSDSGLSVSFASTTTGICTVSGSTVTLVGAVGTCTIRASQAGSSSVEAATPVEQSFQVENSTQEITFGALANKLASAADFDVSATSDSGLSVSFASTTTDICTVSGSTVTLAGALGTCTIRASQAGSSGIEAATPVDQSFEVKDVAIAFGVADTGAYEGSGPKGTTVSSMYGFDRPKSVALCIWYETREDSSASGVDKIYLWDGSQDFTRLGVSKPKFVILPSGRTSGKISTKINYDTTPEAEEHYDVVVTKITTQVGGQCVASSTADPRVVILRSTSRVTIFDDDTPVPQG